MATMLGIAKPRSLLVLVSIIVAITVAVAFAMQTASSYLIQREAIMTTMKRDSESSLATLRKNIATYMEAYAINEYDNSVLAEIEPRQHFAIVVRDFKMGQLLGTDAYVSGKIRDASGTVKDFEPNNASQQEALRKAFRRDSAPILSGTGEVIGDVAIYNTDDTIRQALRTALLSSLLTSLVSGLVLTSLLILLAHRFLARPLASIAKAIRQQDQNGIPTGRIPTFHLSEIATLADAMNAMVRMVRVSHDALVQSRERLQNVIDGTRTGTWEWNVQTGETVFNARWAEIIGYTLEELEPLSIDTWMQHTHPDDLKHSGEMLGRHFSGELPYYEYEARMRHKDGHWVWVLDRGKVISRTSDGKPLLMAGTHQDITGRKQAETDLRLSEERYQLALQGANDGLWDWALKTNKVYYSPRWKGMLGYTDQELRDDLETWRQLVHPEDRETALALVSDLIEGRAEKYEVEFRMRHKDGHWVNVLSRATLHRDALGEPVRLVGTHMDISERKQVERMKDEFVSMVSHELRTPLTSIVGSLGLIQGGALGTVPDSFKPVVEIALRNSERLTLMINDLLDMDKLVSGKMQFNLERCQLVPLVTQCLEAIKGYGERLGVGFELIKSLDECQVQVDAMRFQQILANFLSNAAKFSGQGDVVEVKMASSGERVRVSVRDHGPGIPASFQEHIFQKFRQADSANSRQRGSTGLGLAITKELAERMGGSVGFESVEGEGATFYVELPICI